MLCRNCEDQKARKYSKYTNGQFCSRKCARAYSTKEKREEINKKVSKKLGHDDVTLICGYCNEEFDVDYQSRNSRTYCSISCASSAKWDDPEYRENIVTQIRERCSDPEERKRLRDIGRKGGFGETGITEYGIRYESRLERDCFNFLCENNMDFEPHKNIPNSSKVSDIFILKQDLWIEIDGIDRESKKKWLGRHYEYWKQKLQIYKDQNLQFEIVYNLDDLKEVIL